MWRRVNFSGLLIAGLGFFLTRFTVTLALYEDPVRFFLAGIIPLTLGLGLAAFGVALAVADIDAGTVRTVAIWAVIGAGTMLVLALLTLFGSSGGEMPALATVRSRAYLSNFLIGGSVGGTLTGLYASRNRQHRSELQQQANRLEVLNRLLRHEVLNALTVIRGNATRAIDGESGAGQIIHQYTEDIEETINQVKYLARSARADEFADTSVSLLEQLQSSIQTTQDRYPEAAITLETEDSAVAVRADDRLEQLFNRLFERVIAQAPDQALEIEVAVTTREDQARVTMDLDGELLSEDEQALLETGDIPQFDDPSTGFRLNIARLLLERYRGTIEVSAEGGRTTIDIQLPRAGADGREQQAIPSGVSGIRPALPHLVVTLLAAIIAGVVYGIGSELLGGSVAGIGVFYGTASPVVGWITHQFHSAVFGFLYAGWLSLLPAKYRDNVPVYVAIGLAWGLALWSGAAGVIAPIWLRLLGIPATIPNLTLNLLVAHVSWGLSLGLLTALGYRHLVPWFDEIDFPHVASFDRN